MKRKILSLILVFAMTVSLFTVGASAAEPTYGDTNGHWAESSIERWSAYGIIQGSNGKFDPNGQLTCAQLATILARLLKLPAAKDAGFIDNPADAWYYDAINRCAAAGILKGNGDGTVTPEAPITRERAMVMLARALGIEPLRNPDLTRYTDAAQVSAYAQGYVAALIEAGIVGGVTADELAPQDNINRASTVTILDRAIGTYADKAGETVNANGKGIVLVVADDVTVTGEVNKLLVPANDIEVTVKGSKNIDDITVSGDNSKVILDNASADNVTLDGEKSAVETKNGAKIDNVIMSENASGATVDVGSGTTVGNVENHAEDTSITGNGTVKKVESDKDITVKTKDTDVKNIGDEKITVTDKSGKDTTIGTTGSGSSTTVNKGTTSSGGGGGSYTPPAQHTHTWDAGVMTKEATCTEAGVKTYTCTTCSETRNETIAALGHAWGAYTVKKHAVNGNDGEKTFTCSRCHTAIENAPLLYKFYLGIKSGSTVDMTVGEDYTAVFTMPAADGTVNTASIDLTAKMQDVASLGVEGVREHKLTVNTNLGDQDVKLSAWLRNCYDFEGATIKATIDDKECTYTLGRIDKTTDPSVYTITADTNPAEASAAWQALTSHVKTSPQPEDDSKIVIGNGSWMKIGKEWLRFEDGVAEDLVLDNFSNMSALQQKIRDAVCLDTDANGDWSKIVLFVKAGTQLAVGQSIAELENDCTITITGNANQIYTKLGGKLAALRDTHDTYTMTKNLVELFDAVVGTIDASNNVTVNMTFGA